MSEQPVDNPRLSVVIPAFNEADRLTPTLRRIDAWAGGYGAAVEVLVVDDGSSDGTPDLARGFAPEHVAMRVLVNEVNRGKGHSVRRGMLEAGGDVRLMCDADESTPIEEVGKLLPWVRCGYDVVIGSRDMPDSVLDPPQPRTRRLMARVFRTLRAALLLPELRDTQCGFKCFTREAARQVFEHQRTEGFAFDCEALGLAQRFGFRIKEVGVLWRNHEASKIRPLRDAPRMLRALVQIRRRLHTSDLHSISPTRP